MHWKAIMTDSLRDRIAALLELLRPVTPTEAADAVIRELVELRRIDQVREVCVASLNLDRTAPGEVFCDCHSSVDRAWLADSILNILNGMTDE